MLFNDLKNEMNTRNLSSLLKEYFNYSLDTDKLTIPIANKLLESANKKILEFKNSDLFHTSENNKSYLGLLTSKQLLESFLMEVYIPKEDIITYNKRNYYTNIAGDWYRLIKGKDGKNNTKKITDKNTILKLNDLSYEKGLVPKQVNPAVQPQVNKTKIQEPEDNSIEDEQDDKWHHKVLNHTTPIASHAANFLGATVGAFKAGLRGEGIHKDWGKMLPSTRPISRAQLKQLIDDDFLKQDPFIKLNNEQKIVIEKFLETVYTNGKVLNHKTVLNMIKKDKTLKDIPNEVKAQIGTISLILNKFAQKTNSNESVNNMKRRNNKVVVENTIKRVARRMLNEGEVESAESLLASKDLVDRLQDTIEELGKMSNDELPHLVDAIRNSFGAEKATAYQSTANSVLNDLLNNVKEKKAELENATLVLSGDASANTSSDLNLPNDENDEVPEMDHDELLAEPKTKNSLGRETRIPTEESLSALFNCKKRLNESFDLSWDEILEEYRDDIEEFNETGDMSRELARVLAGFYRDEIPMGMEGNEFEWIYDKFVDDLSDEGVLRESTLQTTKCTCGHSIGLHNKECKFGAGSGKKCPCDHFEHEKKEKVSESTQVLNVKIIAINEALKKTDKKKKPVVAKRLAEELRRLVTEAVKKEAKDKKDSKKKVIKKKVVKEAGNVAAKVRVAKEKNPEKFCKNKTCLYRTDAEYCPKHKPVEKK